MNHTRPFSLAFRRQRSARAGWRARPASRPAPDARRTSGHALAQRTAAPADYAPDELQELEQLADVPVFNELFKETVKGLLALWNAMKPLIDQTIQWFGDMVKGMIKQWITPLLEPLDKIVADAINLLCA